MATDDAKTLTPTAAVARHVEWLEYALAAARDEEIRRQGRLDRATDKNREKRTIRLAEVTAEVRELGALVSGLKGLQTRAARSTAKPKRRAASTAKAAAAAPASVAAPKPAAAKPPAKASAAKPTAKAKPAPKASAAKPAAKASAAARPRRSRTTRA